MTLVSKLLLVLSPNLITGFFGMRGNGFELKQGMVGLDIREKLPHWKGGQALKQAAQGNSGTTIPGSVQKVCRRSTLGHGLAWTFSPCGTAQGKSGSSHDPGRASFSSSRIRKCPQKLRAFLGRFSPSHTAGTKASLKSDAPSGSLLISPLHQVHFEL